MDTHRAPGSIRVVLADDHAMFREGIKGILTERNEMSVVGEAENAAGAIRLVHQLFPDVLLLDIRLPDRSGLDVATELAGSHPAVRVLVLSAFGDDAYVRAALEAGVAGYVLKTAPGRELIAAIRAAHSGSLVLGTEVAGFQLGPRYLSAREEDGFSLSSRETEVLELTARGLRNKQIAAKLGIGLRTVETHIGHLLAKTSTTSRTELVMFAVRNGLVAASE